MQIKCKNCEQLVLAADINLERAMAKCRACHAVFSFAGQVGTPTAASASRERGVVPLPRGFLVEDEGRDLRISRKWFTPVAIFMLFFCIAWDGFLVLWYFMALTGAAAGPMGLVAILFPICHVAVGVGLTYFTAAQFLNSTTIRVSQGSLSILHGPLPWRGVRDIPVRDIEQVYCKEKAYQNRRSTRYVYEVYTILRGRNPVGDSVKLLGGLHEAEQALYIEQALEKHLGLADRSVGGEIPR